MTDRPMRADAVRNRRKILDAATAQITDNGADVGMDEIARAAGVAVGTLYRHYPTKADLLAAVVREFVGEVADDAEASLARVRGGARAVDEVVAFLTRAVSATAHNQAVKSAARSYGVAQHEAEVRASDAMTEMLRIAQADGDVRQGITVDDIYLLASTIPSGEPSAQNRWLELVLAGLLTAPPRSTLAMKTG